MRSRLKFYPALRSEFSDIEELAGVINRSRRYCQYILSGVKDFTHREKVLILEYIGAPIEKIDFYFRRTL